MMDLDEAIVHAEEVAESCMLKDLNLDGTVNTDYLIECAAEHRQLAEWLRELKERRKAPEIVRCGECTHYIPILSNWGKCGVHSSPTEKYRTCQICDYCSWAEKREEKSKWAKNPYSAGSC